MARVPEGAELIPNRMSGAPGIRLGNLFLMAGVPHITAGMLDALTGTLEGGRPLVSVTVGAFAPESEVAGYLREAEQATEGVAIGSYPFFREGRVGSNFVVRSEEEALAEAGSGGVGGEAGGGGVRACSRRDLGRAPGLDRALRRFSKLQRAPDRRTAPGIRLSLERVAGIEPARSAWEADRLPLHHTRSLGTAADCHRRAAGRQRTNEKGRRSRRATPRFHGIGDQNL